MCITFRKQNKTKHNYDTCELHNLDISSELFNQHWKLENGEKNKNENKFIDWDKI